MGKIKIDEKECIGCGLCAEICPKTFKIEGDNVKLKKEEPNITSCEKEAIDSCPTGAIKISKTDSP